MQEVKRSFLKVLIGIAAIALPTVLSAQTSSINAFSPYSMYGLGELSTQGSQFSRSMGGVGIAMRSYSNINLLNPASFSAARPSSFLFNFGMEGQNYYNSQTIAGQTTSTSYNTFNLRDIAFQMPVAKNLGLGFSVTPYSSVGYRINSEPVFNSDFGWVQHQYLGEGDISQVKLGLGWEPVKDLSFGVAALYYWGDISRNYIATPANIVDNVTLPSTSGVEQYSISKMKLQVGVQWNAIMNKDRILTFGATYDLGGDLDPTVAKTVAVSGTLTSIALTENENLPMRLPSQLAAGVFYQDNKWKLGADLVYQDWQAQNNDLVIGTTNSDAVVSYVNTTTIKLGAEYTPDRFDVRRFWERWSYRAGVRYGDYYQSYGGAKLKEYAITAGVSVPVRFMAVSALDFGVEYGGRQAKKNLAESLGLVNQRHLKFSIGFNFFAGPETQDYWFVKPKYD